MNNSYYYGKLGKNFGRSEHKTCHAPTQSILPSPRFLITKQYSTREVMVDIAIKQFHLTVKMTKVTQYLIDLTYDGCGPGGYVRLLINIWTPCHIIILYRYIIILCPYIIGDKNYRIYTIVLFCSDRRHYFRICALIYRKDENRPHA